MNQHKNNGANLGFEDKLWEMADIERENARAQLRVLVKRILRKYGYPPDKQEQATELVLVQTEVLCSDWVTI